jgi:uncharacterized protein (TIGR01777 family)
MGQIIALSGANGFVGHYVQRALVARGYEVWPLVRVKNNKSDRPQIYYDYERNMIDREALARCSAVIHLAGKNIMQGIWTKKLKKEIWESRIASTKLIARTMAELAPNGPKVLISASASGYYGDCKDAPVDERTLSGAGFLARLCESWEAASFRAKEAGIRVVNARFGLVLGENGGLLQVYEKMFSHNLGVILGKGTQYMPVVAAEDLAQALIFCLENPLVSGPVNVVCESVTNENFTNELALSLHKRTRGRVPEWLLKLLVDQSDLFLYSANISPRALLNAGFKFQKSSLKEILADLYPA